MFKILKKLAVAALVVLVLLQFFGPEKNVSDVSDLQPFLTETNPPADVQHILKVACYDCHSNNTEYPWYGNIEPISYWMNDHVTHGKEELNFSEWSSYSTKRKDHKLEEIIEEVAEGHMPISSYLWTHTDATLTEAQVKALADWITDARAVLTLGKAQGE